MTTITLNDHLCFKLYVASRLVIRGYGERLAPLGLTYPKYLVLLALHEDDGQTVGDLAKRLRLDFGTLSPLIKALATIGYVERQRSREDERSVSCRLTRSGKVAVKKAMAVAVQLFRETEVAPADFIKLRDDIDAYIQRCERIVHGKQKTKQQLQR